MQSKVERSKLLSLPIFGFAQVINADESRIFLGIESGKGHQSVWGIEFDKLDSI